MAVSKKIMIITEAVQIFPVVKRKQRKAPSQFIDKNKEG
jgi:hypothetical protein